MPININNIAVLVVSCDKYSDLWSPFFSLFRRFWPDCPFPVYLLSNQKSCDINGVVPILVGEDVSWSDNLRFGLDQINEEFILMWIEDLLLIKKVDTEVIQSICSEFIKISGNYIRLNHRVKPDVPFNKYFGHISSGAIYRTSTVLSLWRKDVLHGLLKTGESAWDFEIYGTVRSDKYDGFYSSCDNYFKVINCIIKGKWQRNAVEKITSLGIEINTDKRQVMSFREHLILLLLELRSSLLVLVPSKYRRHVKDMILRGTYRYNI